MHYNYLKAKLDYGKSHIEALLKQGRARVDIDIEQLMLVNSGDISDDQRHMILKKCQQSGADRVVITHGTGTMVETAKFLGGANLDNKVIVLVGAMIPYAFKNSDALFNLGAAVAAAQLLSSGVYVTMNGKIFSWDNVKKDFERGEFQTL